MLPVFPDPYPDELLYSVWARMGQRLGYLRQRDLLHELFGDGNVIASVPFSSHLHHLVACLPANTRYTVAGLVQQHTLLPFFAPFLPVERVAQLTVDMTGTGGPRLHTRAGIMASSVPSPTWLRYCPLCVVDDRIRMGECYWRRAHQIAGVHVCARHLVWLERSTVPARAAPARLVFTPADTVLAALPAPRRLRGSHERTIILTLAQAADALLARAFPPCGLDVLHTRYMHALQHEGFATLRGRIHMTALCDAFDATYSAALLRLLHCQFVEDSLHHDHWLARLVRTPRAAQHPLHHLLLHDFLSLSWESVLADATHDTSIKGRALQEAPVRVGGMDEATGVTEVTEVTDVTGHFGPGPWPCWNAASDHYSHLRVTQVTLVASPEQSEGRSTGIFACPNCGYTYRRIYPAEADTISQAPGRQRRITVVAYGTQWEKRLQALWADPTCSVNAMAHVLSVDPYTVKRQAQRLGLSLTRTTRRGPVVLTLTRPLRGHSPSQPVTRIAEEAQQRQRYRKAWRSLLAARPGVPTRLLRRTDGGTYTWLYRHDKMWLQRHLPVINRVSQSNTRVDWAARDAALAVRVRASGEQLLRAGGKPQRISLAVIGRAVGHLALLQQHLDRLPETAAAIAALYETREAAAVRRVQWVAEQWCATQHAPLRWELIRRAGVERLVQHPVVAAAITAALSICTRTSSTPGARCRERCIVRQDQRA